MSSRKVLRTLDERGRTHFVLVADRHVEPLLSAGLDLDEVPDTTDEYIERVLTERAHLILRRDKLLRGRIAELEMERFALAAVLARFAAAKGVTVYLAENDADREDVVTIELPRAAGGVSAIVIPVPDVEDERLDRVYEALPDHDPNPEIDRTLCYSPAERISALLEFAERATEQEGGTLVVWGKGGN